MNAVGIGASTTPGSISTSSGQLTATSADGNAARRKVLSIAVGCMLQEAGCQAVEKAVVGTLVEILQGSE